jgi:hypothetical protein
MHPPWGNTLACVRARPLEGAVAELEVESRHCAPESRASAPRYKVTPTDAVGTARRSHSRLTVHDSLRSVRPDVRIGEENNLRRCERGSFPGEKRF